jgi:cobalt-zinc-cadmium resistance protein CzcA
MELKSHRGLAAREAVPQRPGVVDVSSFGGASPASTRSFLDPDKLIAYGLSIAAGQQQLAANNTNAGGSFIEQGEQQINVRESASSPASTTSPDRPQSPERHRAQVKDIATVVKAPRSASARSARPASRS